ncbi:MAG: hypothetical protein GXO07_02645 [Crenarchaeota archaeon]|nr:hypothetical protein [Thermoproteota archaeon]
MSEERLKKFVDSVSKLKGVSYVAAGAEGLPYLVGGTERENAEYVAAVASSLYKSINDLTTTLNLGREEWSKVFYPEDYRMLMFEYDQLTVAVKYEQVLEKIIESLVNNLKRNAVVKCYRCGNELTFEVVRCPKCGTRVPFTDPTCWSCGADLRLKECPYCGTLIFNDGGKPSFITLLIYKIKRIFGG